MKKFIYRIILNKIWGWKIIGQPAPELKKYLFIVAPHTSNWDFLVGIFIRGILKFQANFLGKASLFKPPYGWIFSMLGGYPVDRSKSTKLVDQVAELYAKHDRFVITVTPEGTRKKVAEWKTGFYFIAVRAKVPILPVVFDWGKKEVRFEPPYYPTDDLKVDLPRIKAIYKGATGKQGETVQ